MHKRTVRKMSVCTLSELVVAMFGINKSRKKHLRSIIIRQFDLIFFLIDINGQMSTSMD